MWGGDAEHVHEWLSVQRLQRSGVNHDGGAGYREREDRKYIIRSNTCPCGAWLGSLGLEPTPELFVEHVVECFRAVRRVLRDDGTLWVNMGDSYAGSGKGPSNSLQPDASQMSKQSTNRGSLVVSGESSTAQRLTRRNGAQFANGQAPTAWIPVGAGYKPKDLMEIPSMVAQALRADGWYLRSRIPWLKRNAMPESVTDRPASSIEYVFLLSKSARYFWDADAVRVPQSEATAKRYEAPFIDRYGKAASGGYRGKFGGELGAQLNSNGRNRRNGDWFFESWQGLLLDEQDAPLALVVNPAPLKIAHYASFPPKLVEPMVKASTRPGDTVLDPFAGSGTTLMVADRLGRNAIGCELSESYSDMGTARVVGDAPMFVEMGA